MVTGSRDTTDQRLFEILTATHSKPQAVFLTMQLTAALVISMLHGFDINNKKELESVWGWKIVGSFFERRNSQIASQV